MIEVLKSGLATSIQDLGRIGFGNFGVPKSGAMDLYAAKFSNLLTGNSEKEAVMEITQLGPTLRFHCDALVGFAGLKAEILLNGEKVPINEAFAVGKNSVLEIKRITKGNRIYLSVFGGFQTKKVLNSRSMYEGITPQSRIKKGGFLKIAPYSGTAENQFSSIRFEEEAYFSDQLHVFSGPEFALLSEKTKQLLLQNKFTVSKDSNRMAYLLEEQLKNEQEPILTGPVLPGTVQLTAGGNLIVLMRDCQITGGYPRVLQVSEKSLNVLAQKKAGDKIGFHLKESDTGRE